MLFFANALKSGHRNRWLRDAAREVSRHFSFHFLPALSRGLLTPLWRRTAALFAVVSTVGLCGCAMVNDLGLRAVSTRVEAYVLVNGALLPGQVLLVPDRSGRAQFAAPQGAIKNCMGGMRYTASNGGTLDLRCDDGTEALLQVIHLSDTRGYGYGNTADGPVSVVFGLSPADARAYLRAPTGKKVVERFDSGLLELE